MQVPDPSKSIVLGVLLLALGCGGDSRNTPDPSAGDESTSGTSTGGGDEEDDDDGNPDESGGIKLDVGEVAPVGCGGDLQNCELIDLLFVIDNSGTMGEEQLNLAANFPRLIERLQSLTTPGGTPVNVDVNIMVTTSDFGHPLCTSFQPEGYQPARGAPIFTGCNQRISQFTSVDPFNPVELPEACTTQCPMDITPGGDPFIHFDPYGSNVVFNDIVGALSCVAPQGISGCGYEGTLETMLHALRPEACWNDPERPECQQDASWGWVSRGFIRRGSTLAIAIISDEEDCSVAGPDGYGWFTDPERDEYWLENPELEGKAPSSAVCWNTGVECVDADDDGTYEECHSRADSPALHPVSRYTDFLKYLEQDMDVDVVMLGVLGVPPVTARDPNPPYVPTAGGVNDLVYREWKDGVYDGTPEGGDILPDEWEDGITAAHKKWEMGIGPGCTGVGDEGSFTGQASPPVRVREVCQSLDGVDEDGNPAIRCCIESICDDDFSAAMDCLSGIVQGTFDPVE